MREIPVSTSLLGFVDELEYTEAALLAHPDTKDLAAQFDAKIDAWGEIFAKQRAAWREVTRADAVVAVKNVALDAVTLELSAFAYIDARRDRTSPAFRRFFPVAPSELVRQRLRRQCERTRDVILPELRKLDAGNPLRRFEEPLAKATEAAIAALDARVQRKGDTALTAHEVETWKEGVNLLRRTTHGELAKIAATQGYAKSWPEAFFRPAQRATVAEEAEPAAAPAKAG